MQVLTRGPSRSLRRRTSTSLCPPCLLWRLRPTIAESTYSPFQWARGWLRGNSLPVGLDPKKAFGQSLLLRTKAEEAFVKADAAIKLSKLKNTVARATGEYRAGSLAMLWRARVRHGHGGWTGPLRVFFQEGLAGPCES